MSTPFFTIITATYNAASTLPRLLESLVAQTCCDFTWVVQDGGSTDSTLAVIKEWQDKLPAISLESIQDKGVYDAWNRALDREQGKLGQWVLFIGADDMLAAPDVLEKSFAIISQSAETPCFWAAELERFNTHGGKQEHIFCLDLSTLEDVQKTCSRHLPMGHGALFHASSLFLGRFDARFRICADYDFVYRALKSSPRLKSLPVVVTKMFDGGLSSSPSQRIRVRYEELVVAWRYAPKKYIFSLWRCKAIFGSVFRYMQHYLTKLKH